MMTVVLAVMLALGVLAVLLDLLEPRRADRVWRALAPVGSVLTQTAGGVFILALVLCFFAASAVAIHVLLGWTI